MSLGQRSDLGKVRNRQGFGVNARRFLLDCLSLRGNREGFIYIGTSLRGSKAVLCEENGSRT